MMRIVVIETSTLAEVGQGTKLVAHGLQQPVGVRVTQGTTGARGDAIGRADIRRVLRVPGSGEHSVDGRRPKKSVATPEGGLIVDLPGSAKPRSEAQIGRVTDMRRVTVDAGIQ